MIRILLVDDQNLIQQGIQALLDRDTELRIVGAVKDGRSAIEETNRLKPDIVLIDIEMPGMDGITAIKYISRLAPKTKVIVLTSYEDRKYVMQALVAGAKGYILKSSLLKDLKQAILAVDRGYSQIESRLLAKIFDPDKVIKSKNKSSKINDSKLEPSSKNQKEEQKSDEEEDPKASNLNVSSIEHSESTNIAIVDSNGADDKKDSHTKVIYLKKRALEKTERDNPDKKRNYFLIKSVTNEQEAIHEDSNVVEISSLESKNTTGVVLQSATAVSENGKDKIVIDLSNKSDLQPSIVNKSTLSPISNTNSKIDKLEQSKVKANRHEKLEQNSHTVAETATAKAPSYKVRVLDIYQTLETQYKPKVNRYSSKMLLILRQLHRRGWLGKIGFFILGIILFLVIH